MASVFDETGLTMDRYADIRTEMITALTSAQAFGEGLNTADDSVISQAVIRPVSTLVHNQN